MSSTKTHCIDPRTSSLTLCGRKWATTGMMIAQGTDDPTCSHCLKAMRMGAESREDESPAEEYGFGLRRAIWREGSKDKPCEISQIIASRSISFNDLGRTCYALEVWWWGYPPE